MHIKDILASGETTFSFEFFPPRTPASTEKLFETIVQLESGFRRHFVERHLRSGRFHAADHSDRVRTAALNYSRSRYRLLTLCRPLCQRHIGDLRNRHADAGVSNLLALRGDLPRGANSGNGSFAQAAELVRAIRQFRGPSRFARVRNRVAGFPEGHPDTPNRLLEMDYLKAKVEAGADYICTQLFSITGTFTISAPDANWLKSMFRYWPESCQ